MRTFPWAGMLAIYLLCLLIDTYIIFDIRRMLSGNRRKVALWIHGVVSGLCIALVTTVVCWPKNSTDNDLLPLMWMIYVLVSIYIPKIIYIIFSLIGRLFRFSRNGKPVYYGAYCGMALALFAFGFLWWGVMFTRNELRVNRVNVESDRLPTSFDGFRIVQFSDAHVGSRGDDVSFVAKMVDSINSLQPDLIVFTGDIVNRATHEMEPFLNVLSRLKAREGVYSVLGNHDYGDYADWRNPAERDANNALMAAWQRQIGWRMLNNSRDFISRGNDSIVLIGVENWGEPPFKQYGSLDDAYSLSRDSLFNVNDRRFKVLLSHNPEHWNREVSKVSNIDLTLSGHTHAMQFMLGGGNHKWSPAMWIYEQWGGLYERKSSDGVPMRIYVNIGSGEVGFPSRLGSAKPEITEITLRRTAGKH